MKKVNFLLVLLVCLLNYACSSQVEKINGISFVASRNPIDDSHIDPAVAINTNYAAIMPFGFLRSIDSSNIIHNTDRQWFGETRAGAKQYIEALSKRGIKIMIKPQIWVRRGEYTGFIMMTSESNWKALEESYSNFILEYASLAEQIGADILCIGTELELFVKYRPDYWSKLIKEIRTVYRGKLTYAANWDEFRRVPFWDQLDFIGIDAYFPLSDKKTPSIEDCMEAWKNHKTKIKDLSQFHNKPILFTEYGYRSVDYTAKEPWKFDRSMTSVNLQAQVNATEALYLSFWSESWFAGGFIWKWFHNYDEVGGHDNYMFTPQNKPVEAIIKRYYKQEY